MSARTVWFFHRIIHDHGFTAEDYRQYKPYVFRNTIYSLLTIIRAMDKLRIDFESDERLVRSYFVNLCVQFVILYNAYYTLIFENDLAVEGLSTLLWC